MLPRPTLRRLLPVVLSAAFVFSACSTPPDHRAHAENQLRLAAPSRPAGTDVLPGWRTHFEAFSHALPSLDTTLIEYESADSPPPPMTDAQLAPALGFLDRFTLGPNDALIFPPIHGPETPFPDHQPLRHIAALRTVQARRALAAGDWRVALALVRQNLAQARATLRSEEGIIPLIHATGVWQSALDGAHALARSPSFPPDAAHALLAELQADAHLAQVTLDRALRGEYWHVYRVIVDRMPKTDDPDLILSSVASLGMAEPEPLEPGELGLGLTDHVLLDRDATLAAYEADLAPYLAHFQNSSRFPRGLFERVTAPTLTDYRRQLGAFHDYAGGEEAVTLDLIVRARAAMETTSNPVGKLLAIYLTPPWEVLIGAALRREAQRSAACGLLAWRIHGRPASWEELVAAGVLTAPPADPFSDGPLRFDLGEAPRVWSIYFDAEDNGGHLVDSNSGQPADLVWIY